MAFTNPPHSWAHSWLKPLYDWLVALVTQLNAAAGGTDLRAHAAITSDLSGYTYSNGTLGVGATLTAGSNAAFSTQDGVAAVLNNYYLVTAQSTAAQNGLYKLTTLGTGSTPAVLTRAVEFDTAAEMKDGCTILIKGGTVNADTTWKYTGGDSPTVGSTSLTFSRDPGVVTTNTTQSVTGAKTFSSLIATLLGGGTAQALSGAGAVNVTTLVTKFTSTAGSQALTLADGTVSGQLKLVHHTVDGGSGVLTPANAGNFANFTLTAVHDWALFMWNGTAWDIIANGGGTIG